MGFAYNRNVNPNIKNTFDKIMKMFIFHSKICNDYTTNLAQYLYEITVFQEEAV